jgi:hypothetical protein
MLKGKDRLPPCTISLWLDVLQLEVACMTQLDRSLLCLRLRGAPTCR